MGFGAGNRRTRVTRTGLISYEKRSIHCVTVSEARYLL